MNNSSYPTLNKQDVQEDSWLTQQRHALLQAYNTVAAPSEPEFEKKKSLLYF